MCSLPIASIVLLSLVLLAIYPSHHHHHDPLRRFHRQKHAAGQRGKGRKGKGQVAMVLSEVGLTGRKGRKVV